MISLHGIASISTIPDKIAPIAPSMLFYTRPAWKRMYINMLTNGKFTGNLSHQQKYGLLPETTFHCEPLEIIQIDLFGPWTFYDVDKVPHQIQGTSIIDISTRWVE
jgi:hypothetical protein